MSQPSACRIIKNVSICLAEHLHHYIHFPQNGNGFAANTASFYEIAHFPRVSGCVDCTHIRIDSPGGDRAEVFRNRKGWFSLNVQVQEINVIGVIINLMQFKISAGCVRSPVRNFGYCS